MTHNKEFGEGRWREYTFEEQLGNIGSEISRALHWKDKNKEAFDSAIARAFELMDFTVQDCRWKNYRLKELVRVRELMADALYSGREYGATFEDLNRYFFDYALAARKDR